MLLEPIQAKVLTNAMLRAKPYGPGFDSCVSRGKRPFPDVAPPQPRRLPPKAGGSPRPTRPPAGRPGGRCRPPSRSSRPRPCLQHTRFVLVRGDPFFLLGRARSDPRICTVTNSDGSACPGTCRPRTLSGTIRQEASAETGASVRKNAAQGPAARCSELENAMLPRRRLCLPARVPSPRPRRKRAPRRHKIPGVCFPVFRRTRTDGPAKAERQVPSHTTPGRRSLQGEAGRGEKGGGGGGGAGKPHAAASSPAPSCPVNRPLPRGRPRG